MDVYPVAGHYCMKLNLSWAHALFFTRNIVILENSSGNIDADEIPDGQKITKVLEDIKHLVVGRRIADYKNTLNQIRK